MEALIFFLLPLCWVTEGGTTCRPHKDSRNRLSCMVAPCVCACTCVRGGGRDVCACTHSIYVHFPISALVHDTHNWGLIPALPVFPISYTSVYSDKRGYDLGSFLVAILRANQAGQCCKVQGNLHSYNSSHSSAHMHGAWTLMWAHCSGVDSKTEAEEHPAQ